MLLWLVSAVSVSTCSAAMLPASRPLLVNKLVTALQVPGAAVHSILHAAPFEATIQWIQYERCRSTWPPACHHACY
jgi:hypothetical protein